MELKDAIPAALEAIERLLKAFAVERYVYLVLTAVSFMLLIYTGYLLLNRDNLNTELVVALFSSSGLIAASSARISLFFNKAFTIIEKLFERIHDEQQ